MLKKQICFIFVIGLITSFNAVVGMDKKLLDENKPNGCETFADYLKAISENASSLEDRFFLEKTLKVIENGISKGNHLEKHKLAPKILKDFLPYVILTLTELNYNDGGSLCLNGNTTLIDQDLEDNIIHIIKYASERNAFNINYQDKDTGKTFLMQASLLGAKKLALFLIRRLNANVNIRDKRGLTAKDYSKIGITIARSIYESESKINEEEKARGTYSEDYDACPSMHEWCFDCACIFGHLTEHNAIMAYSDEAVPNNIVEEIHDAIFGKEHSY